ncbi:hypothetical protein CMU02_11870 [Elizabethkingia anophelis]|uniref:hypothetical protein n=1 Tax=Elizabethkingia anophelis TaxID=1117645 RepID=UPI00293C2F00|nr:hypothetical protein [Elizabethkingia anophelis]MDV3905498.1 hypothetical protein [Elizabethkingia anophelis]
MGRYATYPTEIERLKMISIADLKRMKLLTSDNFVSTTINWTNRNTRENTGSISVSIHTGENYGTITFNYKYRDTDKINYTAQLITRQSNLGKGKLWFFVCPNTGKVCRKLHLINGYFVHRSINPNLMYEKQLESKKMREWSKRFGILLDENVYSQLYSKHFKKYYRRKPTKRYLKLIQKIRQRESIDVWEFENSLLL